MTIAALLWLTAAPLIGGLWLRRLLRMRGRLSRTAPFALDDEGGCDGVPVSVIVAAKDEAHTIAACVNSVLAQDHRPLEFIAVDDRSRDGTGETLRSLAAASGGRLRAFGVDTLPSGWTGKNHAVDRAVARASGEWLCFTDADTRLTSPRTVALTLRHAVRNGIDFLTIVPDLDAPTMYERLLQPLCCLVLLRWTRPHASGESGESGAYANGPFMLVSRACYAAIGGHRAVRAELNEDVRLAQRAKAACFRLEVIELEGLCRTRMYTSMRGMWRGWSRLFCGCSDSSRQIARTAAQLLMAGLFPAVSLAAAVAGLAWAPADTRPFWLTATAAWLFVLVVQQVTVARIYRRLGASAAWAPGFAAAAAVVAGMLANAALKRRGMTATVWRDTTYRAGSAAPPDSSRSG